MRLPLPCWFKNRLIKRAMRTPYFHLDDYMERYWLVPFSNNDKKNGCYQACIYKHPFTWLFQRFGIAIRIHKILRSDSGRDFHNHPWNFISIILDGCYTEVTPLYDESDFYLGAEYHKYEAGDVLVRQSKSMHRLILDKPVWTLFITGPKKRTWAFLTKPNFLTKHHEYKKDV